MSSNEERFCGGTMKHFISLGAGVQSSTMALMAAHGEITPMPEVSIFADTQAEPQGVYDWLNWLETQLPFPVIRVQKKGPSLEENVLKMRVTKDGRKFSSDLPLFCRNADGTQGKIMHRSCTIDYKVKVLLQTVRKLANVKRGCKEPVLYQWIGISRDEAIRMKPSREPWAVSRWPLIEAGMSRGDCLEWMKRHGYPLPPKSACVFCPFHSNHEWRRLRDEEPTEFQRAVEFERKLQEVKSRTDNFDSTPFLHRSLKPLDQVDFSTDVERGQLLLWGNECEGMCGV